MDVDEGLVGCECPSHPREDAEPGRRKRCAPLSQLLGTVHELTLFGPRQYLQLFLRTLFSV